MTEVSNCPLGNVSLQKQALWQCLVEAENTERKSFSCYCTFHHKPHEPSATALIHLFNPYMEIVLGDVELNSFTSLTCNGLKPESK